MTAEKTGLSVILPAYNEHVALPGVIFGIQKALKDKDISYEIVVVDDGSTDGTQQVIEKLADSRIYLIRHQTNLGVGKAFADGIQASNGKWLVLMDADGQMDPDDINTAYQLRKERTAVLGYRENRADNAMRKAASFLWNMTAKVLFDLHVKDIDCGLKLIPGEIARSIRFKSHGAGFFPELLLSLQTFGVSFTQFPVRHYQRIGGKATGVKPQVVLRAYGEALELFGRYDSKTASLLLELRLDALPVPPDVDVQPKQEAVSANGR